MDPSQSFNSDTLQQYLRSQLPDASSAPDQQHQLHNAANEVQAILAKQGSSYQEDEVEGMLQFIKTNKLAQNKPLGPLPQQGPAAAGKGTSQALKWVQPSGPRQPGQGTENEEQGIVAADPTEHGGIILRVTLLAAGFIIGPSGTSIRDIMRATQADIKSWTENSNAKVKRPCRLFVVEGEKSCVAQAACIMSAAVDRYKELCEGRYSGQSVPRIQHVMGIDFSYQPPPRNVVPYAASLKAQPPRAKITPLDPMAGFPTQSSTGLPPLPPGAMRTNMSNAAGAPHDYFSAMATMAQHRPATSTYAYSDNSLIGLGGSGLSSAGVSRGHSRTSSPGLPEDPELAELAAKRGLSSAAAAAGALGGSACAPPPDVAALAMAAAQQAAAQVYQQFASLAGSSSCGMPDVLGGMMMGSGSFLGGGGAGAGGFGAPLAGGQAASFGSNDQGLGAGAAGGAPTTAAADSQMEVVKELMAMASKQDSPAVAGWALQQLQAVVAGAGAQQAFAPDFFLSQGPSDGNSGGMSAEAPPAAEGAMGGYGPAKQASSLPTFGGAGGANMLGHGGGGLAHWGSAASELQRVLSGFSLASDTSVPTLPNESSELSLAHSPTGSMGSVGSPAGGQKFSKVNFGNDTGAGRSEHSGVQADVSILPAFDRASQEGGQQVATPVLPKSWSRTVGAAGSGAAGSGAGAAAEGSSAAQLKMFQDPVVQSPSRYRRIKKGANKYYSTAWGDLSADAGAGAANNPAAAGIPAAAAGGMAKYGLDVPLEAAQADAGSRAVGEVGASVAAATAVPGYDSE